MHLYEFVFSAEPRLDLFKDFTITFKINLCSQVLLLKLFRNSAFLLKLFRNSAFLLKLFRNSAFLLKLFFKKFILIDN